ncbi:zinc finger CCCH domain-containing protein 27-like [Phragmites australis]|uniref:zinc finger CCCH domain-containing protein 27-like n=1 Tax=Phragmites australis TaxID=29695 RepID=UPI002D7720AC|nr:zinc finger CCCH domain-containing protein 27-like [Phragmites australis]XP_062225478.1 zinc finger CCCH domain-containing protein 27-like [Phragmites australis]
MHSSCELSAVLVTLKMLKESSSPALDADRIEVPSPMEENNSTNSEAATDTEDFEISDDDDDRNHKHRKREARPQLDENTEEQHPGMPLKKRSRVSGNGQLFGGSGSQGEAQKDFVPKFKRRPGAGTHTWAPRVNQSFRADSSASATARPPMTRGRGRNGAPWTQHDPRFNTFDMIDFASQMASQGPPAHPSLFMGTALPSGPYGFMPGMPHGILDPMHPLGMQRPIQPAVSPLIDLSMPRQRCRDFEERGFCLRGDMCPMEHGVNRIVVDDMQSLSQFNLPVSVPNAQGLGIQNEGGTASVNLSSLGGSKGVPAKDVKSGVASDALKINGSTASAVAVAVADADVYDPDQPLWNNEQPEASCAGFVHTDAGVWNAESSGYETGREHSNQVFATDGLQSSKSTVWGRIAPKRKSVGGNTAKTTLTNTTGNQRSDYDEMAPSTTQVKFAASKDTNGQSNSRIYGDVGRQSNRASHKASRTLYVHGIPQESNRWEKLLSHFQKFGQVIDIYIPSNSEKAFVQFSKREEAEAALKAPDAVMGNRFIKLWWANRDRIPDEGEGRISANSSQLSTTLANSAPQPSYPNKVKENVQSTTPRASSGSSAEPSGSSTGPKMLPANSIKSIPPDPKRQESLELLEELRKKQEILAQKRDEFRRQLEKLAKQKGSSNSIKHAEAGGKEVVSNDASKVTDARSMNVRAEGSQEIAGKLEKKSSGELASHSQKAVTSTQKSAAATKQTIHLLAPPQNRFKLDNRTTSFRILPPLPPEIANESTLADHFSSFGELSSVVLEDTEAHNHDATLKPSLSCSACVTYTTRQSAEKAFIGGKSCKGHTLRFMWLTASPGSNNHSRPQKSSIPSKASSISGHIQSMSSESPSPVGKISSTATSGMAANPHNKSISTMEQTKTSPVGISKASCSSSSLSSNVECSPEHGATRNVVSDSDLPQ